MLLNGVRAAAIRGACGGAVHDGATQGGADEREQTMAVSLRESVERVSDPQNLDASVEEVFRLMLEHRVQARGRPGRRGQ